MVKRETRGGIGFDLVLEQATSEAPAKSLASASRQLSVSDIELKLKAAEERRKSLVSDQSAVITLTNLIKRSTLIV